jgi:hypothetical protein
MSLLNWKTLIFLFIVGISKETVFGNFAVLLPKSKLRMMWGGGRTVILGEILGYLALMSSPHVVFQYIPNKTQRYTVYFIWKLLYMFRVVPSLIIRSANNCIYSIWYLSHRYCYLPLSWKSWNCFECAVGGVPSPINRSANNCIFSIWYLSHRYCYLPLSW